MCSARLGDPTPEKKGFLSRNPFKYIEPIGFVLMILFGFGWEQPVPTTPMYYKDRKKGILITYITPSVVNLLIGVITVIAVGILDAVISPELPNFAANASWLITFLQTVFNIILIFARCNIAVALFNILPVYPLDGSKILTLFLPPSASVALTQYEKVLQIVLLLLLAMGLIGALFDPLINIIMRAVW